MRVHRLTMPYYRATDRSDRAKAFAGVLLVHAALGAIIMSGLNVRTVGEAVERMTTFNIEEAPPPPRVEPPPPPVPEDSGARDEAAPANIRSRPTPVVAPEPEIALPVPLPVTAAETPGPEGADRTAGAANVPGAGTGAGGQGSGFGGGGTGGTGSGAGRGGGGRTPAVLVRNIPRSDYRRIGGDRLPQGQAGLVLQISPQGRVASCRVVHSSGDSVVDSRVCDLATRRLRFRPARDSNGRPIPYSVNYMATWSRR